MTACFSRWLLVTMAIVPFCSCSSPTDPEQIAAAFIEDATKAFAERDPGALRTLISGEYLDSQQRDGEQIVSIARLYIMRSRSIYLFSDLEFAERSGDLIQATVLAAFAARPVTSRSMLPQLDTDIYWFEIALVEERGIWKLLRARWRPAMLDDIFTKGS